MNIQVASLTLRFYRVDGWTETKVRKLLTNKNLTITYRKDNSSKEQKEILGDGSYFAVYENLGHKVFKKSEIMKHRFVDTGNFGRIDWYINEDR